MSRYSLSDEANILNRLDQMNDSLYRGHVFKEDTEFSIKTIRNLLLELYFIRQHLSPAEAEEVTQKALIASQSSTLNLAAYESNKPF